MQVYELSYLILPSIAEDALSGVIDKIKVLISEEGGKEIDSEAPFKHPLAYEMSKTIGASRYVLKDAYLGWIKFEIEPSGISAIKSGVEKLDEVLRFLITKAPRETTFTFAKAKVAVEEASTPEDVGEKSVVK
ncbi:MAG: hypothetical protein A3G05_00780 [Candidatus Zambryskibacteria bacterium RIFCSPLOWO2_12_FULL_45_14]|uniref:Small ribosomal subunit protein bS6 n=2 Tax=Candidatus Zambryskiibacteriota TaxID=1817925 RepID=A0A1G2UJP4_9BACT|nr:MAG: hypothetical protein A3H60_00450 [Candidatus Zambryskibacteria bacterium RIFCSPLOWO2_02_FULL_44_12b]OHB13771.1 MAG: hypothetical protein A3G05_00780 [Candidatus Zambryskibacteria bacterium RIFCSPLOWO2_12_FULL_45_14]